MKLSKAMIQALFLCLGLLFSSGLVAKVDVAEQKKLLEELKAGKIPQLSPAEQHLQASQLITTILVNYHYKKPLIDNSFSEQVFNAYLKILDGNHSYLTLKDVTEFERYKYRLDNYLRYGDVSPAYEIFNLYLKRWVNRYKFAIAELDKPINFEIDEEYSYDRTESSWAIDMKALDELWRKRVKNDVLNLKLSGKEMPEIKALLTKRYKASMRRKAQEKSQDVFYSFMNAVTTSIEPHTNYYSPRDAENFKIEMALSLDGIGAVLQADDVYTKVISLVTEGPADKTGEITPEDRIIGVAQGEKPMVDVIGWRLDDVVELIRGKSGSTVRLEVLPKSAGADANTKIVSIERATVKLEEQSAKAEVIEVNRGDEIVRFGVIDIPRFYIDFEARYLGEKDYKSTTSDVKKLITDLQKQDIDGIIIDLRNNGGGALDEATDLTGLFIDKGPVVQQRNYNKDIQVEMDRDPAIVYAGPLAVLVNRVSASASEIFAAAIQDYGRGLVLGSTTFGKGTVQTMKSLDRRTTADEDAMGQLKFTFSKFYRINGESTQNKGVVPDISYPSAIRYEDFGESAYENALPWDVINAVDYIRVGDVKSLIPQLQTVHNKRIADDKDFLELVEDINEYVKNSEKTSVSLNFKKRQTVRENREQKLIERENERLASLGLDKITSVDDIDSDVERPDPLMQETAQILKDYIDLIEGQKIAYVKEPQQIKH